MAESSRTLFTTGLLAIFVLVFIGVLGLSSWFGVHTLRHVMSPFTVLCFAVRSFEFAPCLPPSA